MDNEFAYCTYCSAKKDGSKGLVHFLKRYQSKRIDYVNELAIRDGATLVVLSGSTKYDLLKNGDEIEFYDEILEKDRIKEKFDRVAPILKYLGIKKLYFYWKKNDPGALPYYEVMRLSCLEGKIKFISFPLK